MMHSWGMRNTNASSSAHQTLAEKVWSDHVVRRGDGEPDLLYIDLHLVHEVTSPQAFDGLRLAGRTVRRPDLTIATEDHNIPTIDVDKPIADPVSRTQVDTLRANCEEFGVRLHPLGDADQGIVHVVGPQLGLTQPGTTVVCGDSHTSTSTLRHVAGSQASRPHVLDAGTSRWSARFNVVGCQEPPRLGGSPSLSSLLAIERRLCP